MDTLGLGRETSNKINRLTDGKWRPYYGLLPFEEVAHHCRHFILDVFVWVCCLSPPHLLRSDMLGQKYVILEAKELFLTFTWQGAFVRQITPRRNNIGHIKPATERWRQNNTKINHSVFLTTSLIFNCLLNDVTCEGTFSANPTYIVDFSKRITVYV